VRLHRRHRPPGDGGWKWPAIQFSAFFVLAYLLSFAAVRLLS